MKRTLIAFMLGMTISASPVWAAETTLDVERECRSISEPDRAGCRCLGLYFLSRFGPDEGAAALHLVGRSYVPEPQVTAAALYERFGADRLDGVAYRILETHDEVIDYCPFSTHIAE